MRSDIVYIYAQLDDMDREHEIIEDVDEFIKSANKWLLTEYTSVQEFNKGEYGRHLFAIKKPMR